MASLQQALEKGDYHYHQQGVCKLLVAFAPAGGKRDVTTIARPTAVDETYDINKILAELYLAVEGITLTSLYANGRA